MEKYYVLLDDDGYIRVWSYGELENSLEITSSTDLFGKIGSVQIKNNQAVLDTLKESELISNAKEVMSFEDLVVENEILKRNQEIQNEAIADLGEMIASIGGGSNG